MGCWGFGFKVEGSFSSCGFFLGLAGFLGLRQRSLGFMPFQALDLKTDLGQHLIARKVGSPHSKYIMAKICLRAAKGSLM